MEISEGHEFRNKPALSFLLGFGLLLVGSLIGSMLFLGVLLAFGYDLSGSDLMNDLISNGGPKEIMLVRIGQGISALVMFGGAAYFWARAENPSPFGLLRMKSPISIRTGIVAALLILFSLPLVEFINMDANQFSLPAGMGDLERWIESTEASSQETILKLLKDFSFWGILVNTLIIALIPALVEEMFFRGFVQRNLQRVINAHAAVWIGAFIFSFIHFQFLGFFSRMFMGAMLGYLFLYSRSLWPSIIAHFANNFLNLILALLAFRGYFGDIDLETKQEIPVWVALISAGLTGISLWLFVRIQSPKTDSADIP